MKLISGMHTKHEVKESRHKHSKKGYTVKKQQQILSCMKPTYTQILIQNAKVFGMHVDSVCPALKTAAL